MLKAVVEERNGRKVILMDSISCVTEEDEGHVVVAGSHGGLSAAEHAVAFRLAAVFLNDAGVGKERAGIAALDILASLDVPGGTVGNFSAKIGDAQDMWENGVISHVNDVALREGLRVGHSIREAVAIFLSAA